MVLVSYLKSPLDRFPFRFIQSKFGLNLKKKFLTREEKKENIKIAS